MNNKINFKNLNDLQKIWISELSYVDLTEEGYKKIIEGGLTVKELKQYVKNPDLPFCGDILLGAKMFNTLSAVVLGNDHFPTKLDIVNALIENGLSDLKIKHTSDYPTPFASSFQALTLEDDFQNTAISYRGSDLYISNIILREWLESNILEYFSDTSTQVKEAIGYFKAHKNLNGNNYIYGYSLGGNLVSHVYLNHHDEIKEAFSINGTPINQKLIDTEKKKKAFNDKKFSFNIVCGDLVGQLKSCDVYKANVNYIQNNNSMKESVLSAHLIQASAFDGNGNFLKITEQEMQTKINRFTFKFINLSKITREKLNRIDFKLNKNNMYTIIDISKKKKV